MAQGLVFLCGLLLLFSVSRCLPDEMIIIIG